MQMGRWFGFRAGYRDLVRLYIGNREPIGSKGKKFVNLYEAFHAICKDEEDFREELQRYSNLDVDKRITPKQVPPLVPSHMLPPTSRNKMYNAVLEFENFGGRWFESTVAPDSGDDLIENQQLMKALLESTSLKKLPIFLSRDGKEESFEALSGPLQSAKVIAFLDGYRWLPDFPSTLARVLEFLNGKGGNPNIDSWLLLAPQPKTPKGDPWVVASSSFAIRTRNRVGTGLRYAAYSEPSHRAAAERLANLNEGSLGHAADQKRNKRQGIVLFYPVLSSEERAEHATPTMAFALLFPANSIPNKVTYKVRNKNRPDDIVVPVNQRHA